MIELPSYFAPTLSLMMKKGVALAELFYERKVTTLMSCEDQRIEKINTGIDQGIGLRSIHDLKTSYAYTNDITELSLKGLAYSLTSTLNSAKDERCIHLKTLTSKAEYPIKEPFDTVSLDSKSGLVRRADKAARGFDPRIRQVKVIYSESMQEILLMNSEGELVQEERPGMIFIVQVIAAKNGDIQTGYEAVGGRMGMELFEGQSTPENIARIAAQRAILMLDAPQAPTGPMTVVLSSEAGGTMVHEAIGHGLEADLVLKGISVFSNRMGEKVASPLINVIDDATLPGKRGSFFYDDEGVPAQKTVLVENGILKGYMYDRLTAMKSKVNSTGNGRRESYQYIPIPRMTNTCIVPGNTSPEEIVSATPKGLLIKKMGGGQVDTVTGDFVFEINEGYLIHKGKIANPIRGATLIGNGPKILQDIDMVGADMGYQVGTCGKDGQAAPVSDAQPTLRIKQIVVGGQQLNG